MAQTTPAEQTRLQQADEGTAAWRAWGPYLSERAWGTVREDYSAYGEAWDYFPQTTPAPGCTAGMKTGWPGSATNARPSA